MENRRSLADPVPLQTNGTGLLSTQNWPLDGLKAASWRPQTGLLTASKRPLGGLVPLRTNGTDLPSDHEVEKNKSSDFLYNINT